MIGVYSQNLCDKCDGDCCKSVVINTGEMNAGQERWANMRGKVQGQSWRIDSRCKHLRNGKCRIHLARPKVCRDYVAGGPLCHAAREYQANKKGGE